MFIPTPGLVVGGVDCGNDRYVPGLGSVEGGDGRMSLSYSNKTTNRNRRNFVQYAIYQDTATTYYY
jgi:hypothetical protein